MERVEMSVEKLNAMANVLSAMKDTYFPDRSEKDDIVKKASKIILEELNFLSENK